MIAVWYGVLAFMISTYIVLDGRNFGAGILHWVVAREPAERRQVIAAIGPLWAWHEVWLVAFGGVLFVAFPRLLASAFAGYYLAIFLILWCGILRGVALEVGGHLADRLWQSFWDAVLCLGSVVLALVFGVALGNVVRGVPLQHDGSFHMAFFTNFRARGQVGLLDWYTVTLGLLSVVVLAAHGATYLAARTIGPVRDRSAALARKLWIAAVPGFVVLSAMTLRVRPELFEGLARRPLAWLGAALSVASFAALALGLHRKNDVHALRGSTFLIQSVLATGAITLYPNLLVSTLDPADALTAQGCAAPGGSLLAAAVWWPFALALSCFYFFSVLRFYKERVGPDPERDEHALP